MGCYRCLEVEFKVSFDEIISTLILLKLSLECGLLLTEGMGISSPFMPPRRPPLAWPAGVKSDFLTVTRPKVKLLEAKIELSTIAGLCCTNFEGILACGACEIDERSRK